MKESKHVCAFVDFVFFIIVAAAATIATIKIVWQTNTFQAVIVTDSVRTYAMFNYAHLGWTTHAEAGGDSNTGQGGVPAYVNRPLFLSILN